MEPEEPKMIETKKRGFWLTAFLLLMSIANLFTGFVYFSNPQVIIEAYPSIPEGLVYAMGLLAAINFILAVAIWRWRKIGIWGFYASATLAFCINIYIGLGITNSLVGLIVVLIIYLTTRKKMHLFS